MKRALQNYKLNMSDFLIFVTFMAVNIAVPALTIVYLDT